jgi:hypothetical protein
MNYYKEMYNIRNNYKPTKNKFLFIGESPPANETFFYLGNSNLFKYTRQAFENAYQLDFIDNSEFLDFFKSECFYLEDLCLEPVNRISKAERTSLCEDNIEPLAERLLPLKPRVIICVKKSIVKQVKMAIELAGFKDITFYELPFPACGNQKRYVYELVQILSDIK